MLLVFQVEKRQGTKSSFLGDFELEDPRVTSEHHSVSLWRSCELTASVAAMLCGRLSVPHGGATERHTSLGTPGDYPITPQ